MNNTGFLHAEGTRFVDRDGRPIVLRGAALGNWLLLEGYMWNFMGKTCNRERLIEKLFSELAGRDFAEEFLNRYRHAFVSHEDIRRMARMGFNSVRVPFNWKHLMCDGPGIKFKAEGFELLDNIVKWCSEEGIYAILDMHAAPGGQTGSNIDDGVDDVARLFLEPESWDKALALWEEIARRYKDETYVGGYDLLNEPIRPFREDAPIKDLDYLIPALSEFYDECIARIRNVDPYHMLSIEGAHWARDTRVFDHLYDKNMCIHFHAYWTMPHKKLLEPYIALSEQYQVPLWLGETGENTIEWFTTLFPMLEENGISWNFWQWKKGIRQNSNYVIKQPDGWDSVVQYLKGGPHPGMENVRRMLDEWAENCRIENCIEIPSVRSAMFRDGDVVIPALSYTEKGHSHIASQQREFKDRDGMMYITRFGALPEIDPSHAHGNSDVRTDHPWNTFDLLLREGEFASYAYQIKADSTIEFTIEARGIADGNELCIDCSGERQTLAIGKSQTEYNATPVIFSGLCGESFKVNCVKGRVAIMGIRCKVVR